jgi:hypothetical protein
MGEYYRIINLDKQEYLCPTVFGDGPKFLEFTGSGNGVLRAQAVLTDSGTGTISRTVYASQDHFEPAFGERVASEFQHSRDHHGWLPDGKTCVQRQIVPACTGRWAGDRIITAGEYTAPYKFMTKVQQLRACHSLISQRHQEPLAQCKCSSYVKMCDVEVHNVTSACTIYNYAGMAFTDISETVRDQLLLFGIGGATTANFNAIVECMLRDTLAASYPHTVTTGKGKNIRHKLDLSWMSHRVFDSFLLRWESAKELYAARRWLRRQHLQVWQRELIKLYQYGKRPSASDIEHVLIVYRHDSRDLPRPDLHTFRPILPSKPYLDAAIALEQAVKNDPQAATIVTDPTQACLASALGVAGRQRVINLD